MMSLRILIFLCILAGIDLYSFQWLRTLSQGWSPAWRWSAYTIFWFGTLVTVILFVFYFTGQTDKIPHVVLIYLRAIAFISYFSKFISLPIVLMDDIRRGAGLLVQWFKPDYQFNPSRSRFLSTFSAVLAGLPFVTLLYGMARNAYRYRLHRHKIPVSGLPPELEGLKIVQISDIHSGSFTAKDPIKKSLDMIRELDPDLLFFTGDMVNYRADEVEPFIDIFAGMKGRYGSFSILGNHDYGDYVQWADAQAKQDNMESLKSNHEKIGWTLLLNEHRVVEIKGHPVSIIGVENFSASRRFSKYGNLAKAYEGVPGHSLQFLLSHDPSHWDHEVNSRYPDIRLTCSGHTHGFQFGVEIPGYFRWSPSQYVYHQWAGLYQKGKQFLYVNRGFGFLGYPGRVGILPEITLLELTAAI